MAVNVFSFDAEVWEHEGTGAWHFVSLPIEVADEIEELAQETTRGFGSVRVEVVIGSTRWKTSVFPDAKRGTYVLPVKKAVRLAEGIAHGTVAAVELEVLL